MTPKIELEPHENIYLKKREYFPMKFIRLFMPFSKAATIRWFLLESKCYLH